MSRPVAAGSFLFFSASGRDCGLLERAGSPVVALNRPIALQHVRGPAASLAIVEALAGQLDDYHLFHATRAELLRALGRAEAARQADLRALELTENPAEQALLRDRLE